MLLLYKHFPRVIEYIKNKVIIRKKNKNKDNALKHHILVAEKSMYDSITRV